MREVHKAQHISLITLIFTFIIGNLFIPTPSVMAAGGDSVPKLLKDLKSLLPSGFGLPQHCVKDCVREVDVNPEVLKRNQIAISLFEGKSIIAKCKYRAPENDQTQCWIGEVDGYPGSTVAVTQHEGTIAGNISFGDELFQINQIPNGNYIIFKVDNNSLPSGCSPIPVDEYMLQDAEADDFEASSEANVNDNANNSSNLTPPRVEAAASKGQTQIDIMLLYTTASRLRFGRPSLEAQIINAVESANQAYRNSLIPMRLKLVHMAEVNYRESNMNKSLDDLQNKKDGRMDEIHSWRDKYGADLVSLVSEDNRYCGLAFTMTEPNQSFAPFAFSVISSDCLSTHTLAHELGHNQGNTHDRNNTKGSGAYPYSFGHRRCTNDNTAFRTIMSYPCSRAEYINYFSNPKISYNKFPTGIDHARDSRNSANCAKSMTNTAKIVASFRGSTSKATSLSAPSSLSATVLTSSSIQLRWKDNSNDESTFKIERKIGSTNWKQIATVGKNVTSFKDKGLGHGTTHRYRIRAANSKGNSSYSNEISAKTFGEGKGVAPKAPSNLTATALSSSSVQLKWRDNSNNESSFKIERKVGSGSWRKITTVKANLINFRDSGLASATTYRYRILSENNNGNSAFSNQVSVRTLGKLISGSSKAPSNLAATALSTSSIQIKWKDNSNDESAFKIERKIGSGNWKQIKIVKSNETIFKNTNLKPATIYSYRVRAMNIRGNSAYSNEITAKTKGGKSSTDSKRPPSGSKRPPSNLTAKTLSSSSLRLQWRDNSTDESGFKIIRKRGSDSWKQIKIVGRNVTNFKDTRIKSGTTYRYRVRAMNSKGNSTYSNEVSIRVSKNNNVASTKGTDNRDNNSTSSVSRGDVPPAGNFAWSVTAKPGVIHFDASSSTDSDGEIISYNWDFGDGTTGKGVTIDHTYKNRGKYSVNLTVIDNDNLNRRKTKTVTATLPERQRNELLISELASGIIKLDNPVSWTVYEDGEDGAVAGWHRYKKGKVRNIPGGVDESKRAIKISGDIGNDVFRLGRKDGSDWNNKNEFFIEFSLALDEPKSGAIYIQLDTSVGTKYLVYADGDEVKNDNPNLIYVSVGDIADGKWHKVFGSLEEDLQLAIPEAQLNSVKALFVYGSLKIDNVKLLNFE